MMGGLFACLCAKQGEREVHQQYTIDVCMIERETITEIKRRERESE